MATLTLTESLKKSSAEVIVVGAGLAGSECAWQLAERGHNVALIEQRPHRSTEAHTGSALAELVCSNSLKSTEEDSAPGLLKHELTKFKSLILKTAYDTQVPAGHALAVDRVKFSESITRKVEKHPKIQVLRACVDHYEELITSGPRGLRPVVIATGPLTHEKLAQSFQKLLGNRLYFYDAIAPIVAGESINRDIAFLQNRHDKGNDASQAEGDYLNCPLTENDYNNFIKALASAEKVEQHDFEKAIYFQGCQPIEALLEKGEKTLVYGPMKPIGIIDPRTNQRAYAVVQLRKEDAEGRSWNMVGFQTKLKYPEQKRIFQMIPGLEQAEFYRYGSLHRNTYIPSPLVLDSNFRLKSNSIFQFAGQITGVEGYLESTAIGALVARLISFRLRSDQSEAPLPPATTAVGALAQAIVNGKVSNFQPMNMNWGLVPLNGIGERDHDKKQKLVSRAKRQLEHWMALF